MKTSFILRGVAAAVVLALVSHAAARRTGPVPPLGPFLDPVHGVWSLASTAKLPDRQSLTLPGLAGAVQVLYDDRAVPHIFASNSEDAARTLGYVVARDRLFQMEMRWRTAAGRLSEIAGADLLEVDRGMRRIGLAWSAERDFARFDSASGVMRDVIAYAEGVNAYIDGLGRRLPLEYRLLGVPERSQHGPVATQRHDYIGSRNQFLNGEHRYLVGNSAVKFLGSDQVNSSGGTEGSDGLNRKRKVGFGRIAE